MRMVPEPITGRYAKFTFGGRAHRLYWEEAGTGIPLLCLHTAGADTRQYRALMNDPEILERFRVIAFDMPWHGKSSPPGGSFIGDYRLTAACYVEMILGVIDGLALDRPVVMGCSIGGRVILHLAHGHADKFRAIIGLQTSTNVPPYYDTDWLHRQDVHGGEICGAIAYGLMAPTSPPDAVFETMWHYMQSGPGVFKGDLHFYKVDGAVTDEQLDGIDLARCPIFLLTGDYDYSGTPEDTKSVADRIGAEMAVMPNLGHFPMSENPPLFLSYLKPVLEKIEAVVR